MPLRLHSLSLVTATVLFSPWLLSGPNLLGTSVVLAQTPTTQDQKAKADRLFQRGVQQYRQGLYQEALRTYQQVLAIRQQLKDRPGTGQTLNNVGEVYNSLSQHSQALEVLQQALAIRQAVGNSPEEKSSASSLEPLRQPADLGETLDNIGSAYGGLGQYSQALETLQQALTIRKAVGDRVGEGKTLRKIGSTYDDLGQYPQALAVLQQALTIQKEIKDRLQEAYTLNKIGFVYWHLQDYPRALAFYQEALVVSREVGNRFTEGQSLVLTGVVYSNVSLGQASRALEFYQQGLPILKSTGNRVLEYSTLFLIASEYRDLGQYPRALAFYQQVLGIQRELGDRSSELNTLEQIFGIHFEQSNYSRLIPVAQEALILARKIPDQESEAYALAFLGSAYASLKDYPKAIEFAQASLTIAREIKALNTESQALSVLSSAYSALGDYRKVLGLNQQSLAVSRQRNEPKSEAQALLSLGSTYGSLGDYEKAIQTAQAALALAQKIKSSQPGTSDARLEAKTQAVLGLSFTGSQLEANALELLGLSYSQLGNRQKAIELTQQRLALARRISDPQMEAKALIALSDNYYLVDPQKAIQSAQQGLGIAQKLKQPQIQAQALVSLGNAYNSLSEYQKVIEVAEQALAIARQSSTQSPKLGGEFERLSESSALRILSDVYSSLNAPEKAVEYAQASFEIERNTQNPALKALTLESLGRAYYSLGDFRKAVEYAQASLEIAQQVKDPQIQARVASILSNAHNSLGDSRKAVEYAQASLKIAQTLKQPLSETFALVSLSRSYSGLGDHKKAIELARQGVTVARTWQDRGLEQEALQVLGDAYDQSEQPQQAITAYREALAISDRAYAQARLARIYRNLNLPVTAITYYKQVINGIEQVRQNLRGLPTELQASFLEKPVFGSKVTRADIYRELADLLLSQGRILEAQQVLEFLKVQELRDFTRNTRAGGKPTETTFTPTEKQILKEHGTLIAFGQRVEQCQQAQCPQLSQLLDQREAIAEDFEQTVQTLEQEIRTRRAKDDAFLDPTKLTRQAQEIVAAQPGTILIYPLVLEDKLWILWASSGGITKSIEVPQATQQQLGETVLKFRQLLQNPNSDIAQVKATGKQLYDWLIPKSLEAELKANKVQNLVFSLDSVTRYIPTSALFDGEKYLAENYTLSTIISADLTDTKDRLPPGTQTTSVLAAGLSDAVPGFSPLSNVPAELDGIVRQSNNDPKGIYPGLELLNQAFDRKALRDRLASYQILHVATHGKFESGSPDASYLVLGNGDKLPISEIEDFRDLGKVHLVVLSACETALGETGQDGTEINGISYYFLNGGAKAVMASLWQVDDESTRLLMQQFYTNLAKGTAQSPITKAKALRQAQLSLIQGSQANQKANGPRGGIQVQPISGARTNTSTTTEFSHPHYWAPFILIGNGL